MLYFSHWHLEVSSLPQPFSPFIYFLSGTSRPLAFKKHIMSALFFPNTAQEVIWPFVRKMEPQASPTRQYCRGFLISMWRDLLSRREWGWGIDGDYLISLPWEKMLKGRFINGADQPCHRRLSGGDGRARGRTLAPGSQWTLLTFHFFDICAESPRLLSWGWKGEDGHSQKTKMEKNWPRRPKGQNEFPHGKGQVSVSLLFGLER